MTWAKTNGIQQPGVWQVIDRRLIVANFGNNATKDFVLGPRGNLFAREQTRRIKEDISDQIQDEACNSVSGGTFKEMDIRGRDIPLAIWNHVQV